MIDAGAAFTEGNDCYRRNDLTGTVSAFRQALVAAPDHVGALANLTIALLGLGRPLAAIR